MKLHILTVMLIAFSFGLSAEVTVIVHPSNTNVISQEQVSKIFLGRDKSFADGSPAIPVALSDGNVSTDIFSGAVLKKKPSQLKAYWSKLVFTGKGSPPKQINSDAEMVKLVAKNPNFIGYVDAASVDSSVKVVFKL